jgi:murein DD-endopeptidase MepM/ murein hydrolase activator NlpD
MRHALGFALMLVLYAAPAIADPPLGPLLDPVTPACVSSPFGPRILPGKPLAGTYHHGLDLPARIGEPVRAVAPGVLIAVEHGGPGGLEMLIQHPGFVGIYSHLGSIALSNADQQHLILAGQQVAVVGLTGVTYGSHLYFEMKVGARPVDPMPYLHLPLCGAAHHTEKSVMLDADGRILPARWYGVGARAVRAANSS